MSVKIAVHSFLNTIVHQERKEVVDFAKNSTNSSKKRRYKKEIQKLLSCEMSILTSANIYVYIF